MYMYTHVYVYTQELMCPYVLCVWIKFDLIWKKTPLFSVTPVIYHVKIYVN